MEVPSAGLFIYKSMNPENGYDILEKKLKIDPDLRDNLIKTNKAIWLIRESNETGMLTIDFQFFENNTWVKNSCRFMFTDEWIKASNLKDPNVIEARKSIKLINSVKASQYVAQLNNLICTKLSLSEIRARFDIEFRVNPERNMQTTNEVYSTYTVEKKSKEVKLSIGVKQAITCEMSQKIFKDPVIMTENFKGSRIYSNDEMAPSYIDRLKNANNCNYLFYKGKSYERSELAKWGVPKHLYYANTALKDVVNCIGSLKEEKIDLITEERLLDPIYFTQFDQPYALPSGFSISKKTLEDSIKHNLLKCPRSTLPFTAEQAVPNKNLAAFIDEWADSQQILVQSIGYEQVMRV